MSRAFTGKARPTTRGVARRAMLRGRSIVNIAEDVRKYAAEQATSEEEALKKGMEEKSKDSSRREASEKTFAQQKAAGRGCWPQPSQFVEKGAEVYAKA